jgi:hypothetical protein
MAADTDQIFEKVTSATTAWLDYQVICGREMLLSEGYLAQPIGEVLRVEHEGDVRAEFNHPIITSPSRGRRRQIDYVLRGRNAGNLVGGLEVKWADDTALSKQRIIDDLLRLECLKHAPGHIQSVPRYFFIAGKKEHVKENFLELQSNCGSGRTPFLPHFLSVDSTAWKAVDVQDLPAFLRKYLKSFETSYRVQPPKTFRTRLVKDQESARFRAMIWRIDSGPGHRTTFSAKIEWPDVVVPETEEADD